VPKNAITKAGKGGGKHTSALWLAQKTRRGRRKEGRKKGRKEEGVSRSIMHMREPRWRLKRRPVFPENAGYIGKQVYVEAAAACKVQASKLVAEEGKAEGCMS
jgi:hypothetical protein